MIDKLHDNSTLALFVMTMILTVVGYTLVLPSAYKKCQPSSVFIFSLAFADLFMALVIVPIKISEVLNSTWQKDIVYCSIANSVTFFGIGMAATNMIVVSGDRVLFFVMPLKYRNNMTIQKAVVGCLIAHLLALPALLPVIGIGGLIDDQDLPFCAFKYSLSRPYLWFVSIAYLVVPTLLIVPAQIVILWLTRVHYKQHKNFLNANPNNKVIYKQKLLAMKQEARIQRMFLLIVIMFIICWGPNVVGIICDSVAPQLITPFLIKLMRILLFINSFINPLIMFCSVNKIPPCCCCTLMWNRRRRRLEDDENINTIISNS